MLTHKLLLAGTVVGGMRGVEFKKRLGERRKRSNRMRIWRRGRNASRG